MKLKLQTLLLILFLIISLITRLQNIDFPISDIFRWGDGTRDFLIANHIVKFHEFPLLGPYNLLNDANFRNNTPIYYYTLALFLLIYNNIFTLSIINIFFQMVTIILIFFIAKKLFNTVTAFVSILLFSFNPQILHQSDFIWQPHLMQFFAYLSFSILVISYLRKEKNIFFIGVAFFSLATALHNSAYPWVPAVFLLAYLRKYLLKSLTVFFSFTLLLYIPVIIFYLHHLSSPKVFSNSIFVGSLSNFFNHLYLNTKILLEAFNLYGWIGLLLLATILWVLTRPRKVLNSNLLPLLALIVLPIIFASFFDKIRLHYLTLSFGVLMIFISRIITIHRVLGIILFIFIFNAVTFNFSFLHYSPKPFANQQIIDGTINKIKNELLEVQNFFTVVSYYGENKNYYYPVLDSLILVPLEEKMQRKLTKVDDFSIFNFNQINDDKYAILVCPSELTNPAKNCPQVFLQKYFLIKQIDSTQIMSVYLAKRKV